jgi:hypothetical protein
MTDELFPIETTNAEFIGFEPITIAEPVPPRAETKKSDLPAPAKPRRRRAKKPDRRVAVRVWFDERELVKLNGRAVAEGLTLPDYLRRRALRDPRVRGRQAPGGDDLFAGAEITQTTVVRLSASLSPEMEERISTYFSPEQGVGGVPFRQPPIAALPAQPKVFTRLSQFLAVLVGNRWPGHRRADSRNALPSL